VQTGKSFRRYLQQHHQNRQNCHMTSKPNRYSTLYTKYCFMEETMVTFTQSLIDEARAAEASPPPEPVSQLELASLKLLRQKRDQLDRESDQLRRRILRRLQAGAAVERGRYTAKVRQSRIRKFSRKAIERVFGQQYAAELAAHLPESEWTALSVTEPRQDSSEHRDLRARRDDATLRNDSE
jgi:hypothetical protein